MEAAGVHRAEPALHVRHHLVLGLADQQRQGEERDQHAAHPEHQLHPDRHQAVPPSSSVRSPRAGGSHGRTGPRLVGPAGPRRAGAGRRSGAGAASGAGRSDGRAVGGAGWPGYAPDGPRGRPRGPLPAGRAGVPPRGPSPTPPAPAGVGVVPHSPGAGTPGGRIGRRPPPASDSPGSFAPGHGLATREASTNSLRSGCPSNSGGSSSGRSPRVAGEVDAEHLVRLPLVPAGTGIDVDHRGHRRRLPGHPGAQQHAVPAPGRPEVRHHVEPVGQLVDRGEPVEEVAGQLRVVAGRAQRVRPARRRYVDGGAGVAPGRRRPTGSPRPARAARPAAAPTSSGVMPLILGPVPGPARPAAGRAAGARRSAGFAGRRTGRGER